MAKFTRSLLKRIVPSMIWNGARRMAHYERRVRIWRDVLHQIRGTTKADQSNLTRSFRKGLIQSFNNLDEWQNPELVNDASVDVPGIGQFHLRAHSDDLYHVLPSREPHVLDAIRQRLKPGSTFVDAGANIGFYTILAARIVGSTGRVIAIEMMPDTAARLRTHVELNRLDNVVVVEHALSDRSGENVVATVPEQKFGRASIVSVPQNEAYRTVTVQTRTLDELLAPIAGPIHLIKMNLESAELLALKGAGELLSRTEAVIIEQLPGEKGAAELLVERGFVIQMLDGSNAVAVRG